MNGLKFLVLSGTTDVTENLYVYEYGDSMMVLDCGVGFPDIEMQGVDLVLPDFSYIKKNQSKLKGILLSQGHEDHIGALPFLMKEVKAPIYSTALVSEFVKDKFEEHGIQNAKLNVFRPGQKVKIGPFEINSFRVNHSVPDTVGFAIDTPVGRIFHIAEYKFDPNPVDGHKFDVQTATKLAKERPALMMASDCLGSTRPGSTPSEQNIEDNLMDVVGGSQGAIFFTTISSNIGRIQQAINVSKELGRKVVLVGRSIERKSEIARSLGYLKYGNNDVIGHREAKRVRRENLFYIIAGCYGQVGSSLYRVAINEHRRLNVEVGDTMVFSANPAPPYTKESQDFVIDNLIDKGLDVHYYDLDEGLYVSGHGSQKDLLRLKDMIKPRYYVPLGGTVRFMHGYEKLMSENGVDKRDIFSMKPGESVILEKGKAKRGKKISVKSVLVHGLGIGDVGKTVLADRKALGEEGFVVAVIRVNKNRKLAGEIELITKGFVFEKMKKGLLIGSSKALGRQINKRGFSDQSAISNFVVKYLGDFFQNEIGREPVIVPVVVET